VELRQTFKKAIEPVKHEFLRILHGFYITPAYQQHFTRKLIEQAFLCGGTSLFCFPDQFVYVHFGDVSVEVILKEMQFRSKGLPGERNAARFLPDS
jgi:hypothetical protein